MKRAGLSPRTLGRATRTRARTYSRTHTHTHSRTRALTHSRAHARAHARITKRRDHNYLDRPSKRRGRELKSFIGTRPANLPKTKAVLRLLLAKFAPPAQRPQNLPATTASKSSLNKDVRARRSAGAASRILFSGGK
eukprot:6211409-Pleurochrysis_carterae.AAC.1